MANDKDKHKAIWDVGATELFIKLCLEQVAKGERSGTTLTKRGWIALRSDFQEKSGRNYDKVQLRNKWDNLRKEWLAWHKLFASETGLGWDREKNTVAAPAEWWEKKQSENPQYAKFRYKGLPFAQELTALFSDVVATGTHEYTPNCGFLPQPTLGDDDVYRPTLEEGSGDSDEMAYTQTEGGVGGSGSPSTGRTLDFEGATLPTSHNSGRSSSKRKRDASCREKKNKKCTPSKQIADAISRIANASESRNDALTLTSPSIKEAMAILKQIPAVVDDEDLFIRCMDLMLNSEMREMVAAMNDRQEMLVQWLRKKAYGL